MGKIFNMILEEATKEAFNYYPSDLKPHSAKPVLAACELCGEFKITIKNRSKCFCKSCSRKGVKFTEEHKHNISEARKGTHESEEQKRKHSKAMKGRKNPNWKGGPVKYICIQCGKESETCQSRIKNGYGKYCCTSCAAKARRHNKRPLMTIPEKAFQAICIKNALQFTFVGDGSLWLGNANPDFVHNTKKIVVEVFGDYWHSPLLRPGLRYNETVEGRTEQLKVERYKCIMLWESDLMREDAEVFVLHTLKTERAI